MPITLKTSNVPPEPWISTKADNAEQLFQQTCPKLFEKSDRILQSSFPELPRHITPDENGFVRAVWKAYSNHHHLVLRPDDIWFAILVQLSFYINANAETLRSQFVAHHDQKQLTVSAGGNIHTVNVGLLAIQMTNLIKQNVIDLELHAWIMPSFTTTTQSDEIVAAVLMMGTFQKYFDYTMVLLCGIPTVTLLGEREDWVALLAKLERIPSLGTQPARFAGLLKPILEKFVESFDQPDSPELFDFWNNCVHHESGSGVSSLSGWIIEFCFWNEDGDLIHRSPPSLDGWGVQAVSIDTDVIPSGMTSVPVLLNDNGNQLRTRMVAGLVGIEAMSGPDSNQSALDSIRPYSGWWMFEEGGKQ
ncbi:hypothetical protein BO94DRAFT_540244 [Aspergillus sclerotioniger CBS 115572]|uniref:DUF4419 domain-containing protein n=1 Tax=Aspergillus sclerotioniger CBS 115572 TaxID=1450535 RepID=A0A317V5K9_9EURO|nr:hypothetical protein BO94DRAFT_540244 [Aspergillus sclerotioniger CBS 115572]PWY68571.1 hypothetical protein BO94DRAFT_540244 [Aspergillus sclerotioniger CBS 115572]